MSPFPWRCNNVSFPFPALAALLLPAPALVAQDNTGPTEPAYLKVKLPADAKLQIGDRLTQRTGEMRRLRHAALAVNAKQEVHLRLKATFKGKDGKPVIVEETVHVAPGKTTEVDLRTKPKADENRRPTTSRRRTPRRASDDKPRPPDVIFVATPPEVVDEMLKFADVKKSDILYDLGCGDGIIVVTAAKKIGCKAVGYDIDPDRVKEAKERVKKAKVEDLVTIEEKDIFKLDLTKAHRHRHLPARRPEQEAGGRSSSR